MTRAIACRSDAARSTLLRLDANGAPIAASAQRQSLIADVRGGKQVELDVRATTFRQLDGVPNRRFLRHATRALPALAASYIGMPVLVDHDTGTQGARIGTVRSSELVTDRDGALALRQTLAIVKPEAVISVLDGTLDRFSIGWSATGPVNCSAHETDVRSRDSCGCWPGDSVLVDGKPVVVEFEFQSADGTEVSAVNVPAVKGTRVETISTNTLRAQLAAELGLVLPGSRFHQEEQPMPPEFVNVYSPKLNAYVALTPELASMARQCQLDPADVIATIERDLAAIDPSAPELGVTGIDALDPRVIAAAWGLKVEDVIATMQRLAAGGAR